MSPHFGVSIFSGGQNLKVCMDQEREKGYGGRGEKGQGREERRGGEGGEGMGKRKKMKKEMSKRERERGKRRGREGEKEGRGQRKKITNIEGNVLLDLKVPIC